MGNPENPNTLRDERVFVAIVRLAEEAPSPVRGDLVALDGDKATLRLPDGASFREGEHVVLVRGEVGARQIAHAAWIRTESGCDLFSLNAHFEPFDVRRDRRIQTHLAVEIWQGDSCMPGTMLDISNGGAAVATRDQPEAQVLVVAVSLNGFSARLPCQVVGVTVSGRQPVTHLKFDQLNVAERAFVRQLVRAAEAAAERPTGNVA